MRRWWRLKAPRVLGLGTYVITRARNALMRALRCYGVGVICSDLLFPLFSALGDRHIWKPPSSWCWHMNGKISADQHRKYLRGVSTLQHSRDTSTPSGNLWFRTKTGISVQVAVMAFFMLHAISWGIVPYDRGLEQNHWSWCYHFYLYTNDGLSFVWRIMVDP